MPYEILPFHKTQGDFVRSIVDSYVFSDFGKITKVNSPTSVDLEVGVQTGKNKTKISKVELLPYGGANGHITIEPTVGDLVLVFVLRSYAPLLKSSPMQKKTMVKYALSNMKAVLFAPASSDAKAKMVIAKNGSFTLEVAETKVVYTQDGKIETTTSGDVKFTAGKMVVNGETDAVVLHTQLATIFSAFMVQLNAALATAGGGAPPPPLSLDLTPAKSNSLKVGN